MHFGIYIEHKLLKASLEIHPDACIFFYIQNSLCICGGCFGCIHTWFDAGCNGVGRPQWISTTVEPHNLIYVFRGGAAIMASKAGRDNYQQTHQHARLDILSVFWVTGYSLSTFLIHCSKTFYLSLRTNCWHSS